MSWIRLDDNFAEHPKVMALNRDRLAGIGLWNIAASYCARHLTDGFVPAAFLQGQAPVRLSRRMVEVGLFIPCDGGYRLHDWLDYNPSRETVMEERRKKQAAGRAGGQASAQARASAGASQVLQEVPNPRTRTRPVPVSEVLKDVPSNGVGEWVDPERLYAALTHRKSLSQKERDWLEDLYVRFSRQELVAALRRTPGPRESGFLQRVVQVLEAA